MQVASVVSAFSQVASWSPAGGGNKSSLSMLNSIHVELMFEDRGHPMEKSRGRCRLVRFLKKGPNYAELG